MQLQQLDLSAFAYGVAALSFGIFLLAYRLRTSQDASNRSGGSGRVFVAAMASGTAWAALGLYSELRASDFGLPGWPEAVLPFADLVRYALLLGFVLLLLRPPGIAAATSPAQGRPVRNSTRVWLQAVCAAALAAALLVLLLREFGPYRPSVWLRPQALSALALSVAGLLLVEQLLRNVSGDARWAAKPVCLGLGVLFAYDLYLYSQAMMFQDIDEDALAVRPLVHSLTVPLLYLASRRQRDWISNLHVSRTVVFHSATMLLSGAYLLLISAVGYYVRYTGGDWGRALQIALTSAALLSLLLLLLSGAMRAKLKVYISKHFFSYRYDYREEWLRFTAMLASQSSPQELGGSIIKGLANLVESPSGALWLRQAGDAGLLQTAFWNVPPSKERLETDASLVRYLAQSHWIIDLDEYRNGPDRYAGLMLPDWLLAEARHWLIIPLSVAGELLGFVLLGRPRASLDVNWEVRDLLRTASSQAASYLAQMQATEALLEARKFDAFNRMSAFVVHDLKNIVTQLSLMMKNARRLRDNPEFQEDMLATVENSLEKMRQLMLQLREGQTPHGVTQGVELAPIARRLADAARGKGRQLELALSDELSTRGHEERIERVIGHVVQNAFDATPEDGRVWLSLVRAGSYAQIEVGDTGCGMSDEFIRTRLFKPFQTTKNSGMGIGAFESFQYLQELGGKINVNSEVNRGTRITLLLPLFHASQRSDLSMQPAP